MPFSSAATPLNRAAGIRRVTLKAVRPSLTDLRFKEDTWVVRHGADATVCLGDYPLGYIAVTPLEMPTLNRILGQIRTGQARRNCLRRVRRIG